MAAEITVTNETDQRNSEIDIGIRFGGGGGRRNDRHIAVAIDQYSKPTKFKKQKF